MTENDNDHPYRTLPHNLEAEKALLGAIFVNNRTYETVSDFLKPEHFAFLQHGKIFEVCAKLIERGQVADPVTLRQFFESEEDYSEIGGQEYLGELAASAVTVITAEEYGRIIFELFLRRDLIALAEDVVNQAYNAKPYETVFEQIETAEQCLYDLGTVGGRESGFKSFRDSVIEAFDIVTTAHYHEEGLIGIGSGFDDLDKILGGMRPSDLLILASHQGAGQTALATNIAYNVANSYQHSEGREGAVVGYYSFEIPADQLASRILSAQSNISSDLMRKGELSSDAFMHLSDASTTLHQIPLFINDTPELSISAIRRCARRLKRQYNLGLVIVGNLQSISLSKQKEDTDQAVAIVENLKALATELDVPVLLLMPLSEFLKTEDNSNLQSKTLGISAKLERAADVVMHLIIGEQMGGKTELMMEAEIDVVKNHHGSIGTVSLRFNPHFSLFSKLDI